jgi:DNA processing protein
MAQDARLLAWARLAEKGLPAPALTPLLRAFGDPLAILCASRAQLASVATPAAVDRIVAPGDPQRLAAIENWLAVDGNELIAWDDPDYPKALLELGNAPVVLFYVGRRELLNRAALAIVGSRHATPQGVDTARAFALALSSAGLTIVSGLALGIDAAAHEGALLGAGSTIAVVGTGLDRVYPARHRALAHAIAMQGGLLSEFFPGTPPRKENFPRRNRLLSGLSRGVLVVEATVSSGSLITARLAGEQGRDVFAIPGSIHSPFSKGCHRLIREGAKLIETAQDVLDELHMDVRAPTSLKPSAPEAPRGDDVAQVLRALAHDVVDLDTLTTRTSLPTARVVASLIELELDAHVGMVAGGRWQRRT